MDNCKFYEVCFGTKTTEADGEYEDYTVNRSLKSSEYSMVIKADHLPTCEEAESFCKEDIKKSGFDGIVSVAEISGEDMYCFFDTDNIDKWPVLTKN